MKKSQTTTPTRRTSTPPPLVINQPAAEKFLDFLDPFGTFAFQTYDDDKDRSQQTKNVSKGRDFRARTLIGLIGDHQDTLTRMNRDGCAIHVTINRTEGPRRDAKSVREVRKHFIETDSGEPLATLLQRAKDRGLQVAWANESSPDHFHIYLNVAPDVAADLEGFTTRQRQLVAAFGGERESVDLPRVLRVPGFWHQKDPTRPFQVRIAYQDPNAPAYTLQDFERALADVVVPDVVTGERGEAPVADEDKIAIDAAAEWFKRAPRSITNTATPDGKYNKKGNNNAYDVMARARDFGVGLDTCVALAMEHWNPRCDPQWSDDELRTIAENAYRYGQNAQGKDHPVVAAQRDFAGDVVTPQEMEALKLAWRERDRDPKNAYKKPAAFAKTETKTPDTKRGIGDNSGLIVLDADKITPRNIDHIWQGRLARGKHTALAGEGGKGKSQIAYDISARISKGMAWPLDKKAKAPLGTVVILSAEDGPDDVMVPRLIAAGANLKNVKIIKAVRGESGERKFNLQEDLKALRELCAQIAKTKDAPPVMLIVLDPVSSYMGGAVDTHRNTAVRHVLDPLTQLAEDVQCAVLSITHFNKGSSAKAVHRVMESAAFVNAPRASFGVFDDIEDIGADFRETKPRLLLVLKTNIGKEPVGLKYHIDEATAGTDDRDGKSIITSRIVWDDETNVTADQVAQSENERAPLLNMATDFLRDELSEGPKPAAEVKAQADAAGISRETLRRAQRKLNIASVPIKGKPGAGNEWSLGGRDLIFDELKPQEPEV